MRHAFGTRTSFLVDQCRSALVTHITIADVSWHVSLRFLDSSVEVRWAPKSNKRAQSWREDCIMHSVWTTLERVGR